MIRFLFNFILFGVFFYLIWRFFPDMFQTLVNWADTAFNTVSQFIQGMYERAEAPSQFADTL